jgi:Tfp pilus assembly protein PilV
MSARAGTPSLQPRRAPRVRAGVSLIEVVVACTLLALTFTSLTALTARMAQRNRSNAYAEQRTATFFEQVNRVESMPYDSLVTYLTTDSAKYGQGYYVWAYTVDPESVSTSARARYRKISLTVTPRLDPTKTQKATIRRAKSPFTNPLNLQ